MPSRKTSFVAVVLVALVAIASGVLFACSETPTSVPVRTFERAQRMDAVCLRLFDTLGNGIVPEGLPQNECAPVPPAVNGGGLQNQLFAVVTQSTRGEVALVDLSAGFIIDQKNAIPGINFVPVGALPTDVAAAPDGRMVFVAAAEPNKPAIYGLPSYRLLGDKSPKENPDGPGSLASWPVCALPQRPGALTIVPRPAPIGSDAGAASDLSYELVAVLPGDRLNSAKVVTIDPRPFVRAAPRPILAPGQTEFNDPPLREPVSPGPALRPGVLEPCPITSAIELANGESVPTSFTTGPTYSDGVDYTGVAIDGGPPLDISCDVPTKPTSCGAVPCRCLGVTPSTPDAGQTDAGAVDAGPTVVPLPDGGACDPSDGGTTQTQALDLPPLDPPQLVAVARDNQTIFVADASLPFIHVVDLSTPAAPRELPPYLATSLLNPSSVVAIRELAVSPPTRDFKRYMYGVDANDGSLVVFDVTDVATAPRTPMLRPNPELNPFQPPDRVAFNSPVVAVAFARHDFPLSQKNGIPVPNAASGVLCNPSDGAYAGGSAARSDGSYYVANSTDPDVSIGPVRLRGIFAFATLSDGSIVALDVDDWDAPCRRPALLDGQLSSLAPVPLVPADPVPYTPATYPWQPSVSPDFVTKEDFYPVSAPHRMRSTYFLRDDPSSGRHIPYLSGNPVVSANGSPLPLVGQGSEGTPRIHPVASITGDRSESGDNGVRFSFEVPDVHFDQDWTVTFEGALPGFDGFAGNLSTPDDYATLRLDQPQASFCGKGVEDYEIGQARAAQVTAALAASGFAPPSATLGDRTADYVQVIDDVLPSNDPYWQVGLTASADPLINSVFTDWTAIFGGANPGTPQQRFDICANTYGAPADQNPTRDFPILQAFDDHLVLGRFFSPANAPRVIVSADSTNQAALRLMRRCFHDQVRFRIRAASEWVTIGSVVGFLNHTTREASGRCVLSCDPRDALLNGRSPAIPADLPGNTPPIIGTPPARNSVLALRNPAISFFVQNGTQLRQGTTIDEDRPPARDTAWQFGTRGQFQALAINLAAQTSSVNPQSMRFIETLGQIAVVDGASQGLVLIDLSSVRVARAPYF